MPGPLSTPLSHLLVAFTIEFDNELDHRLTEADLGHRLPISMVMWSNFLRFVGNGITVGELPEASGIPKSRTLSTLGGMERWRYVFVSAKPTGAAPKSKRDGWGSARALKPEWFVRPTPIGEKVQEIAPPLFGEIEKRWEQRFGAATVDELRRALGTGDRRARRRAPRVPPDRRRQERDGRRDRRSARVRRPRLTCPRCSRRCSSRTRSTSSAGRSCRCR